MTLKDTELISPEDWQRISLENPPRGRKGSRYGGGANEIERVAESSIVDAARKGVSFQLTYESNMEAYVKANTLRVKGRGDIRAVIDPTDLNSVIIGPKV